MFDPHSFLKLNFSILGSRLLIPRSPILDLTTPTALLEPASLLTLLEWATKQRYLTIENGYRIAQRVNQEVCMARGIRSHE